MHLQHSQPVLPVFLLPLLLQTTTIIKCNLDQIKSSNCSQSSQSSSSSISGTNAIKSKFYAPLTDRSSFCVSKMEWKKDGKYNPRASGKDGSRARRLRLVEILLLCYG